MLEWVTEKIGSTSTEVSSFSVSTRELTLFVFLVKRSGEIALTATTSICRKLS